MTGQAVSEILANALRDREFSALLRADPDAALADFDLTDDERQAIVASLRNDSISGALQDRPRNATRLV